VVIGYDPIDGILDDTGPPQSAIYAAATSGVPSTMFTKAVVVEVIYDPSAISGQLREKYENKILNKDQFEAAPRSSLLIRTITEAAARLSDDIFCAYPMFPPHIQLPVKPGEIVWVFDPTPSQLDDEAYWVCRVHGPNFIDDLNYTHLDRQAMESNDRMETLPDSGVPEFPNGGMTQSTLTMSDPVAYDTIFSGSFSTKSITLEVVPRFSSRPGDLALQGSNNTLICLGQDRGFGASNILDSPAPLPVLSESEVTDVDNYPLGNATYGAKGSLMPQAQVLAPPQTGDPPEVKAKPGQLGRGSIDIVTGRGQNNVTKAIEVENSRKFKEVSKNSINFSPDDEGTGEENRLSQPNEGDPDFSTDLSRVYVSMKTSGDQNLDLKYQSFVEAGPDETIDRPYVIAKSNEVRIVGRQTGNIRIVKEGEVAADQCVIALNHDGTVAIDSQKILIGDGRPGQVYIGDPQQTGVQPLVLANALKEMLDTFCKAAGTSVDSHGKPVEPLNSACSTLKDSLDKFVSTVGFISPDAEA
tara:strand:- start:858 stop:2438 length:1581 start_codon:yes stop_codon:yes gene_type:complete